jgi:sugar (pentulose or hexulose) kinase
MSGDVYVGLDLGTSGLKGVALDGDGRALAFGSESYETLRPAPGRAEQDPEDWVTAAVTVLGRLAVAVPPGQWRGIGLSGMIPTLVTLDEAGAVTGPALTWEDCRAHEEAAELIRQAGASEAYEATGQPMDGRYLLPMVAWIARHDPQRLQRTAVVLGAKDYLFYRLTGHLLTDPSTATGYGCYALADGRWVAPIAAAAGVGTSPGRPGRPGVPPVVPSTDTRSLLAEPSASLGLGPGLRVCVGAADSVLAAEALGATAHGTVAYVWGTSTVVLGATDSLTLDPRRGCLVTPLALGGWGVELDLLSTGGAVAWLSRLLGFGPDAQTEVLAAAAAGDRDTPVALPFVGGGEQGALWDPDLRGAVVGLDLTHGPGDVARAVLDGIVLESCRCLARLRDLGLPEGDVRVAWQAADPWFCQRLADASGRTVVVGDGSASSSAAGAARLVAEACGTPLPRPDGGVRSHAPDPSRTASWERRTSEYERVLAQVSPLYRMRSPRPPEK